MASQFGGRLLAKLLRHARQTKSTTSIRCISVQNYRSMEPVPNKQARWMTAEEAVSIMSSGEYRRLVNTSDLDLRQSIPPIRCLFVVKQHDVVCEFHNEFETYRCRHQLAVAEPE